MDLRTAMKRVQAVGLDLDGVFWSNTAYVNKDGKMELKARTFHDGMGILLLLRAGIHVAFITRMSAAFIGGQVEQWNGIAERSNGKMLKLRFYTEKSHIGKIEALRSWLQEMGVSYRAACFMGDDVQDGQALLWVKEAGGLAVAPANAVPAVKRIVDFVTEKEGGNDAIRELVDMILESKGIDPFTLDVPV